MWGNTSSRSNSTDGPLALALSMISGTNVTSRSVMMSFGLIFFRS